MHIVYRLKGSLTVNEIEGLKQTRANIRNDILKQLSGTTGIFRETEKSRLIAAGEALFEAEYDDVLHKSGNGPFHLQNKRLARVVIDSWLWLAEHRGIFLYAICVMGNHVHVLAQSKDHSIIDSGPVLKATKNFTALACNKLIGQTGSSFWEVGYFDRDVRNGKFTTVLLYILNNPVKAKLVENWEEWPGTYLNPEYDLLFRESAL